MESHRIAEHLARELNRSVALVDRNDQIIGASYRIEDASQDTVSSPATVIQGWLCSPHSQRRSGDVLVFDADPAWVSYPLFVDGTIEGWALLGWRDADLCSDELALLDVAASLLAAAHKGGPGTRPPRRSTVRALLDPDPAIRRDSLRLAYSRGWLAAHPTSEVRALIFNAGMGLLGQLRAARELCRALPGRAELLRERDDAVFILTTGADGATDLDAWIRGWAMRHFMPLAAVGSASVRSADEDLARAAYAAVTAAELSVTVPELADMTNGDGLGGWALLNAVQSHRSLLAVASPAAELLCGLGDTPRETVEAYLDEAGHVRAACERLHIHRTTLYYRLDNLPDLVKVALADGMQRSTLHLALKLDRLWSAASRLPVASVTGQAPASRDAGHREGKDE
jgi:hypothetical protein